jgi:hypothetical protein
MKQFDYDVELAESEELAEMRDSGMLPLRIPAAEAVPEVLASWLNRLHAEVYAHPDRLEIRGLVSFNSALQQSDPGASRQASQLGRR